MRQYALVTKLPIIIGEEAPVLRAKTVRVKEVTKDILKILKDMEETRVSATGAGIAAPQVGRSERMCIVALSNRTFAMINPDITHFSKETEIGEEGCLSLPGIWINIPRAKDITVEYLDERGREQTLKISGWDARIIQHEVDHLDGKLIVDYKN